MSELYYNHSGELLETIRSMQGLPDFTDDERREIVRLATQIDKELRYPVVHAWKTKDGSQLQFWCKYCRTHHVHGRHLGPSRVEAIKRWDAEDNWVPRIDAVLPLRLWKRHLQQFADCTFNVSVPVEK
ncbi:hypothetical protein [Mycobacterium avium]|uniref:hypothetical protein n=1 Tax=Mycobacterium avium TaxID=1764 RepID=UPI000CE5397C|nr:hypothetical protein [Mycobacterium avium]